jgi:hypothetical protein
MTDSKGSSESKAETLLPKPSKSKSKKKEVNTMQVVDLGAFIKEIEDADEYPAQASTSTPGFWKRLL